MANENKLNPMDIKPKDKSAQNKKREPRKPRKISETYLHNAGLYYLQRFSASTQRFREVMLRKIRKSCKEHEDQNYDECAAMVEKTIETFLSADLLNDKIYAEAKVNSLRRAGKSARHIQSDLRSKGVPPDLITATLKSYDERSEHIGQDIELEAAKTFARKKRLGPHRTIKDGQDLEDIQKKEMGKMARAGFSYDVAKRVLKE